MLFGTLGTNAFDEVFELDGKSVRVRLLEFLPNASISARSSENGKPLLKVVFGGANGRSEYYLSPGDQRLIQGVPFDFSDDPSPRSFSLRWSGDSMALRADAPLIERVMATGAMDTLMPDK